MTFNHSERREFPRFDVTLACTVSAHGHEASSTVIDLSAGGVRLRVNSLAEWIFSAESLLIGLEGYGQYAAKRVWRSGDECAMAFVISDHQRRRLAGLLQEKFGGAGRG